MSTETKDRIDALARRLHMEPLRLGASLFYASDRHWWLVGCLGGDHRLPVTDRSLSEDEVVDYMEKWLSSPTCRRCSTILDSNRYAQNANVECDSCLGIQDVE